MNKTKGLWLARLMLVLLFLTMILSFTSAEESKDTFQDALVLELRGKLEESLENYKKAVAEDSLNKNPQWRLKAAFLALDLGQKDDALDLVQPLENMGVGLQASALVVRMRCLREKGEYQQSSVLYKNFMKNNPSFSIPPVLKYEASVSAGGQFFPVSFLNQKEVRLFPYLSLPLVKGDSKNLGKQRLQAGVFLDKSNAVNLKNRLSNLGWDVQIQEKKKMEKPLYVVCILTTQGHKALQKLQSQGFDVFLVQ